MNIDVQKIRVEDVEQLSYSVDPWELKMNQLSMGAFHGIMNLVQIGDIFVTGEYWLRRISARGGTPPGYLLLAGPWAGTGFSWCGSQTDEQHLAFAADAAEVDFATADNEKHWTLLIPKKVMDAYLGDEKVEYMLPDVRSLNGSRSITSELLAVVKRTLAIPEQPDSLCLQTGSIESLYNSLLSAAANFLLSCQQSSPDEGNKKKRFFAYQRARSYADGLQEPISVQKLAREVGACRRTLELGFREAIGISPQAFLRCSRLNSLHRELRAASPQSLTVSRAAENWGFTELGRTAGYYRDLFGVPPSETLKRDSRFQAIRFSDMLGSS